jgi:Ca2+-binding RTX toxin-like protein
MPAPVAVAGQTNLTLSPEVGGSAAAEYNPRITGLPGGGFVALWDEVISGDQGDTVMFRRFGADGAGLGPATAVSSDLSGTFSGSGAVTLGNGNVAIGWGAVVNSGPDAGSRVGARIIDPATGTTVGTEIPVATSANAFADGVTFHQIVALSGGRAGLLFIDGAGNDRLRLTVIEANGTPGATTTILTATPGVFGLPATGIVDAAAALSGPNADTIAVVTRSFAGFSGTDAVRFYNLDGSPSALPVIELGDTGGNIPVIAALPNGGLAIGHHLAAANGTATYRVVLTNAAGAIVGGNIDVTFQGSPFGQLDLLGLPDGGVVLAASLVVGGGDFGVLAQRITAMGALDGDVFNINPPAPGEQSRVQLALAGDSGFVAAWFDAGSMFDFRIQGARFSTATSGLSQIGTGGNNTLTGGEGADTLNGRGGADTITGAGGADSLAGELGADTIRGGAGADSILGGAHDDRLFGDVGSDSIVGGTGADLLEGGADDDTLSGDDANDKLFGGDGADSLSGGLGADRLEGGAGADSLAGGDGNDTLLGQDEADRIEGGIGNDWLLGGRSNDTLSGGAGNDRVEGEDGNDVLAGDAGADTLRGGNGNDALSGGDGNDELQGGAGADSLTGGAGADRFLFASRYDSSAGNAALRDVVTDFVRGEDKLVFTFDADATEPGVQDFAFVTSPFAANAPGFLRTKPVDATSVLVLANIDDDTDAEFAVLVRGAATLSADDFVL